MSYQARIKRRGLNHPVQKWAKERNIKPGTPMPAPCPVADKPAGDARDYKKGKPIPYDNKKLKELLLLNGNNEDVFLFATRLGGWLFNSVSNKHLISFLGKVWGKLFWWKHNQVPFPLPKGKKAFAEKIYCDGNEIDVDKVKGRWVHVKAGVGKLTQVRIGTNIYLDINVKWKVPASWLPRDLVEKLK